MKRILIAASSTMLLLVISTVVLSLMYPHTARVLATRILTKFLPQKVTLRMKAQGLPHLSEHDKQVLLSVAYESIDDYFNQTSTPDTAYFKTQYNQFQNVTNTVFVGLRVNGHKRGSWSSNDTNLARAVHTATQLSLKDARYGQVTPNEQEKVEIEIFILGDMLDFSHEYETGVHGLFISQGTQTAYFYNTVAIEKGTGFNLFANLCQKAGLADSCHQHKQTNIKYFSTIHFMSPRFGDSSNPVTLYRSNHLRPAQDVSTSELEQARELAQNWLIHSFNPDAGYFYYFFLPQSNTHDSQVGGLIRQLLASKSLADIATSNQPVSATAQQLHKQNLDSIFSNWYQTNQQFGYVTIDNQSLMGYNGLLLRVLVASPHFDQFQPQIDQIVAGIRQRQAESGALRMYVEPENLRYDFDFNLQKYFAAETILGLVELYQKTGDESVLATATVAQNYYVSEYVDAIDATFDPAYVPWQTMSLYKLYQSTQNERYAQAIFTLNDRLVTMQNQTGIPYPDTLGQFYNPEKYPQFDTNGAVDAVYTEGLTYAYELAHQKQDLQRAEKYRVAITLGLHNLLQLQFVGEDLYYVPNYQNAEGGIRLSPVDHRLRIDSTAHALDAFNRIQYLIAQYNTSLVLPAELQSNYEN